jgi:hypothetical protein
MAYKTMKVTLADYAKLDEAISALDTATVRHAYRQGNFPRAEAVKNLDVRYRWDLLWAAAAQDRSLYDALDGYQDSHIDTALRAIVPPLEAAAPAGNDGV